MMFSLLQQQIETERFNAALFTGRVSTNRMSALEAFNVLSDWISEADSFVQTFGHDDHGDEGGECRFEADTDTAFVVLAKLIAAAS